MYNIVLEGGTNYSNRTVQKYQQISRNVFNAAIKKNILKDNQATLLTIKEVNNERDLYFIIKGDLTKAIKKILEPIINKLVSILFRYDSAIQFMRC